MRAQTSPEVIDDIVLEDPSAPAPGEIISQPNAEVAAEMNILDGFFEDVSYSPQDKRDPFYPFMTLNKVKVISQKNDVPLEPLQRFTLEELKIIGIIWDVGKPKALVQDPQGKSYIVVENTKMGKEMGYIAAIREGEVIVVEEYADQQGNKSFQTKILKLAKNSGGKI